jgi:glucose/arabinose dehydrogenase
MFRFSFGKQLKNKSLPFVLAILAAVSAACQSARMQLSVAPPAIENYSNDNRDAANALRKYKITVADLPKPYATESASRPSRVVPQPANAVLRVPAGFKVGVYAADFEVPRMMQLAPNGDVFVADSRANKIYVLRDAKNTGKATEKFVFTDNLNQPFGMAFRDNYFYVANTDSVIRFGYKTGQTQAADKGEKIVDLPGKGYNQHWTRNLIFSPDGKKLYISVGSQSNADIEPPNRAAILECDPDGKNLRVFASGIRNPVGLAFNPTTGKLWTAVNERDGLGDDLVPDYVTSVQDGGFYGFPFSYLGSNEDPRRKGENPELVKKAIVPDVLIQSHSAALGLQFYDGAMFPAEYRGDAFVALHGSWNRAKLTGYKIIRIRFKDGKPLDGSYEDFLTGWLPDENSREVWGRPVGLLILKDGSMLITDDGARKIWRVSY